MSIAAHRVDQLEALARDPVEDHQLATAVDLDATEVGERGELGLFQVRDQRTCRAHRGPHAVDAEAFVARYGGRIVGFSEIPDEAVLGAVDPAAELQEPSG